LVNLYIVDNARYKNQKSLNTVWIENDKNMKGMTFVENKNRDYVACLKNPVNFIET
jgi:hypothetical protein